MEVKLGSRCGTAFRCFFSEGSPVIVVFTMLRCWNSPIWDSNALLYSRTHTQQSVVTMASNGDSSLAVVRPVCRSPFFAELSSSPRGILPRSSWLLWLIQDSKYSLREEKIINNQVNILTRKKDGDVETTLVFFFFFLISVLMNTRAVLTPRHRCEAISTGLY